MLFAGSSLGQEKCATVEYQKLIHQKFPQLKEKVEFENWLSEKILKRKANPEPFSRTEAPLLTIPVVVHIIHDGEAIGVGKNLAEGQIISQIEVLNEDFRRLNDDASNTPSVFQPVAADIEIEFVLAKRDPEGLPTDGIVRIEGDQPVYGFSEQYELKRQSYWPSDEYLNIWVTDIGDGFIGYAQFPVSSLQGLEDASEFALTDGVVIDFRAFGSIDKYPAADLSSIYNLGRTTTHEVGHFLGLRHTWGDGGCGVDDFCDDTPLTDNSHSGLSDCDFPTTNNGCGSNDMFQNYMTYASDQCMNIFTLDQKARMRAVMEESPRRASLITSKGDEAPVAAFDNLGIRNIISPRSTECSTTLIPTLEIRNYGVNTITNTTINVSVNGSVVQSQSFTLNLDNLDITEVSFSPVDLFDPGNYTFDFEVISVNGNVDPIADNNFENITIDIANSILLPELIDFESNPEFWIVDNLDGLRTWEVVTAPNADPNNQALKIDFFNYEQKGAIDIFLSPSIDMITSNVFSSLLTFDVSYANFTQEPNEGLLITISDVCADPLTEADTLYYKTGTDLSTVATGSDFTPSGEGDWRTEILDLTAYVNSSTVQISFLAINSYGNNLYLDNIGIVQQENEDIGIRNIISPSPVACSDNQNLSLEVINFSTVPIGSFDLEYSIDNGPTELFNIIPNDSLMLGEILTLEFPLPELTESKYDLFIAISNPNGIEDANMDNNFLSYNFEVNNSADVAPIKETFEDFISSAWSINNPDGEKTWEIVTTSKGNSIALKASNYNAVNELDWLVSPSLDFTNSSNAELNFDLAYARSDNGTESLRVFASTNCGQNYDELVLNLTGDDLTSTSPVENLIPTDDSLWRNVSVNLNQYRGLADVRLAFVSTANRGNNIYLDNIQLFTTETDNLNKTVLYPNPNNGDPANLAFALEKKQTVIISIINRSGQTVYENTFENTLNQTYELDLTDEASGLYLVKVSGENFSFVKRLMWTNNN